MSILEAQIARLSERPARPARRRGGPPRAHRAPPGSRARPRDPEPRAVEARTAHARLRPREAALPQAAPRGGRGPLDRSGAGHGRRRRPRPPAASPGEVAVTARPPAGAMPVDPDHYRLERYREDARRMSAPLRAYYTLKPALPRPLQLALRRAYARRQARRRSPRGRSSPSSSTQHDRELRRRAARDRRRPPDGDRLLAGWPRFAAILTHDVEGPEGVANIPAGARGRAPARVRLVVELRRRVVPDRRRALRRPALRRLRDRPARDLSRRLAVQEPAELRGGAAKDPPLPRGVGCGRLPLAGDPPQRRMDGGARLPLRLVVPRHGPLRAAGRRLLLDPSLLHRRLVELPITLVQDHTLFEILRRRTIDLWVERATGSSATAVSST